QTDSTGKFLRWTFDDNDPGDFITAHLLDEYQRLTGNSVNKNDKEIAEIIGRTMRFSSLACVSIMAEISRRAKTTIGSLAYLRAERRELSRLCENASDHNAMTNGHKRGSELKAIRAAIEEWRKKGG